MTHSEQKEAACLHFMSAGVKEACGRMKEIYVNILVTSPAKRTMETYFPLDNELLLLHFVLRRQFLCKPIARQGSKKTQNKTKTQYKKMKLYSKCFGFSKTQAKSDYPCKNNVPSSILGFIYNCFIHMPGCIPVRTTLLTL